MTDILPYITGSGGALIVLFFWVLNERKSNEILTKDLKNISREAVECITKIIEREDPPAEYKLKVITLLESIKERIEKNS